MWSDHGHSSDWLVVRKSGISIINLLVLTGLGILCLWTAVNSPHLVEGFSVYKTVQRYCSVYPLVGNQGCAPRLHYFFLTALSCLCILSLPWLVAVWICCLVLVGVHGGWVKPISYKQEMGDTDFVPRVAPLGPAPFSVSLSMPYYSIFIWSSPHIHCGVIAGR